MAKAEDEAKQREAAAKTAAAGVKMALQELGKALIPLAC